MVHHWAFSDIAASCSLRNSSFNFAFFSRFWLVKDLFLPAACHKKRNYGLRINKKNLPRTVNDFLMIKTVQRTKYSNKMCSSTVTHLFTQDYHQHAAAYCGGYHQIADFYSESVFSSIDHLKPEKNETRYQQGRFFCVSLVPEANSN